MTKVAVCPHCEQVAGFSLVGVENAVTRWKCAFCGTTRKGSEFLHPTQEQEAMAHFCPDCASLTYPDERQWRICPQCQRAVWMPHNGGWVRLGGVAGTRKTGQRLAKVLLSPIAVAPTAGTDEGIVIISIPQVLVFEPLALEER